MKYPQLVSTRAVNAISDWLVSRLEQLGVEAPQIYTRLLLSLLQSTVQINDPIEFSNLETFFANRKGSSRRYLPSDTDTLKKLNAVQCLREIVSSEQEIETIENLVDELCEKLKDIEKQTSEIEDEGSLLVLATVASPSYSGSHHNTSVNRYDHDRYQQQHGLQTSATNNDALKHDNSERSNRELPLQPGEQRAAGGHGSSIAIAGNATTTAIDNETDPKKRYFRAFPALSKEMEDSFRVLRRNAKSLTWPVNRGNNLTKNDSSSSHSSHNCSNSSSSSAASLTNSFSFGANATGGIGGGEDVEVVGKSFGGDDLRKHQRAIGFGTGSGGVYSSGIGGSASNSFSNCENVNVSSSSGVKRKTKRRRNQALSKGKTIQNTRRSGGGIGGVGLSGGSSGGGRNTSPTYWDTDFEGCWEMGPDLIKDFIVNQNRRSSRNRSTSESAAYSIKEEIAAAEAAAAAAAAMKPTTPLKLSNEMEDSIIETQLCSNEQPQVDAMAAAGSPLAPLVDISFCCDDDGYDDTLASVAELPSDNCLGASTAPARRLYQREVSFGSHEQLQLPDMVVVADKPAAKNDVRDVQSDEQADFAQYKAKFNSNIEALWKDAEQQPVPNKEHEVYGGVGGGYGYGMYFLPLQGMLAPFNEDLRNFWTNYYTYQLGMSNVAMQQPQHLDTGAGCLSYCDSTMRSTLGGGAMMDTINTSDYYSMPTNLGEYAVNVDGGNRNSPVGVFLQNSIWSDTSQAGAGDTDESFYFKVWNSSNKRLNQAAATSSSGQNDLQRQHGDSGGIGDGVGGGNGGFHYPTYKASKWSEGINGVPSGAKHSNDCTDSSANVSASTTSCSSSAYAQGQLMSSACGAGGGSSNGAVGSVGSAYKRITPVVLFPPFEGYKSCSDSNSLSLTEMYGNVGAAGTTLAGDDQIDAGGNRRLSGIELDEEAAAAAAADDYENDEEDELATLPTITLPNHCAQTSGFTEYGRIRTTMRALQHQKLNYMAQLQQQPKETYPDDEDLLFAERTHFQQISSYADGLTFDISSALDEIEYKRSASGGLYVMTDKYMEYTRHDNFLAEEDSAGTSVSAAPLYASSNCEAATAAAAAAASRTTDRRSGKDFVLKFRIQNCEIACQTDDEHEVARREADAAKATAASVQALAATASEHPLRLLFTGGAVNAKQGSLACNNAIEALNKAVAAAAKATADEDKRNCWMAVGGGIGGDTATASAIWTAMPTGVAFGTVSNAAANVNDVGCDEVDFYAANHQWVRREVGKKCNHSNSMNINNIEIDDEVSSSSNNNNDLDHLNNNNNNNGDTHGRIHTLWGMCAACNNELKSLPPNRLLRDEIEVDADEIMSDLKYMQDLYIERPERLYASMASDSDWSDMDADIDTDVETEAEATPAEKIIPKAAITAVEADTQANDSDGVGASVFGGNEVPDSQIVMQKVNRLIANLLRPDGSSNSGSVDIAAATNASDKVSYNDVASIWCNNNNNGNNLDAEQSHNIWQPLTTATAMDKDGAYSGNAIELLRQYNLEPPQNALDNDHKLPSHLNWEHGYLAELWQKSTPPPVPTSGEHSVQRGDHQTYPGNEMVPSKTFAANDADDVAEKQEVTKEIVAEANNNEEIVGDIAAMDCAVPEQNTMMGKENASSCDADTLKRVQQFLNAAMATGNHNNNINGHNLTNRKRRHSASQNCFHHHHYHHYQQQQQHLQQQYNRKDCCTTNSPSAYCNNNNNLDVADLNCFNLKLYAAAGITAGNGIDNACDGDRAAALLLDDIAVQKFINNSLRNALSARNNHNNNVDIDAVTAADAAFRLLCGSAGVASNELLQPSNRQKTIITCKYWTTINPTAMVPNADVDGGHNINGGGGLLLSDGGGGVGIDVSGLNAEIGSNLFNKNASILKHVTMATRPLTR